MSKNMLVIDGKVTKYWKNDAPRPSNGIIQGSTEFNGKIFNHEMPFSVWSDKADQIQEGKAYELIGNISQNNYKDKNDNWQKSIEFFVNKITEIDASTVKRATPTKPATPEKPTADDVKIADDEIDLDSIPF